MRPSGGLTRRSLLGLGLLASAGCHKSLRRRSSTRPTADRAALGAAAGRERAIVAGYDAAIARAATTDLPALQVARAVHATHLAALHDAGAPLPATTRGIAARSLVKALRQSASELRGIAINAQSGGNAALFASIAASHEVSALE